MLFLDEREEAELACVADGDDELADRVRETKIAHHTLPLPTTTPSSSSSSFLFTPTTTTTTTTSTLKNRIPLLL